MELRYKKGKKRKRKIKQIVIGSTIAVFLIAVLIIFGLFRIQQVEVVGNEYYTADEIKKMVMSDSLAQNSLYLTWKYTHADIQKELPFLSAVEIEMLAPYKIRIRVYEKTIVGYIKKAGSNVYFDKDGTIMETSQEKREGVPMISGIDMDKPEVLKKLPIKDKSILTSVLNLTQLLNRYEIIPDEIHFDESQAISMYFSENTVLLGQNKYLDEKIANLKSIYPKMETMKGTLDLQNFTQGSDTVTFKKGDGKSGESEGVEGESESESEDTAGDAGNYVEKAERITKDAAGNEIYTDDSGNITSDMTKQYLGADGNVVTDGYGYIDPYTGAYIN